MPDRLRAKILKEVAGKYTSGISKYAFNQGVSSAGIDASAADILKAAHSAIKADPSLQRKVDASVKEILAKENVLA